MQRDKIKFTHGEELWNTWTHGAGIVLGVVAGFFFLQRCMAAGDGRATLGVTLYLLGMLSSYVSSTAYHALSAWSVWKERLRKWDHAAIYWHIAGSYSPVTLIALHEQGAWGRSLFIFVWACALAGTVTSMVHLKSHSHLETVAFVGMGLSGLVAFKPLVAAVGFTAPAWIIAEGVCYITGAVFYSVHHRRYMHTVFHLFVLAGSACHVVAVWAILRALV